MFGKKKKFYISTALPYVNARPHLGFALEIVQADVLARYRRISGSEVFFLTGADENSLKNVKAAEKEGMPTQKLVDRNTDRFFALKKALNLSFDDFIRTTEERHKKGVQKFWQATKKDIYKKKYKGLYCVGCEEFCKESELENGLCPEHKTKPEAIEEENYFFRLSKYEEKLKKIIRRNEIKIVPETRKNEVVSFLNRGLEDICISRSAIRGNGWGIEAPNDPSQIIWVWYDALGNYITALGYADNSKKFQDFWQKNKNVLHIIGKGILRFHAIYWPAMLLSAGVSLPKKIFVHGYITSGGEKMSKSLGNVIDPLELVSKYGVDAVRYFLLREITPFEDGDYTQQKFKERYNADLANGLGNLIARVITLATKLKIKNEKLKIKIKNEKLSEFIRRTKKKNNSGLDNFKFNEALAGVWELIGFCDKHINETRPWEEKDGSRKVISDLLYAIGSIAEMLRPFLPATSEKILEQIRTGKSQPLFPRL